MNGKGIGSSQGLWIGLEYVRLYDWPADEMGRFGKTIG